MKVCTVCKVEKSLQDFHNHPKTKDGRFPYCKVCNSRRAAQWERDNPERARNRRLKTKYGISAAEYDQLLASQGGKCAACGSNDRLEVDHDHKCCEGQSVKCGGQCVRGLLCGPCNRAGGAVGDDVGRLKALVVYFEAWDSRDQY